jgi:hypothetical protein
VTRPQTIQIYLPSGNPTGIRIASITTRTVSVFDVPRPLLSEFLNEPEAQQVGLYFLIGAAETDERPQAYIGETGNVDVRMRQQIMERQWWTRAIVAVSLTNAWTRTHVGYMEWLSIDRAAQIGRYAIENRNRGSNPYTPRELEADCHEFLETVGVLLAALGVPILEEVRTASAAPGQDEAERGSARDLLYFREAQCDATGYLTPEGLFVMSGSTGRMNLRPSAPPWLGRLRDVLREQGIWEISDGRLVMLKPHLFSSPSKAGGFLVGGSNNGRTSWKNADGLDLNHIEADQLSAASGPAVQPPLDADATVETSGEADTPPA